MGWWVFWEIVCGVKTDFVDGDGIRDTFGDATEHMSPSRARKFYSLLGTFLACIRDLGSRVPGICWNAILGLVGRGAVTGTRDEMKIHFLEMWGERWMGKHGGGISSQLARYLFSLFGR